MVSIIMPSYNHGSYIASAIQSVIEQSYDNLELIIVDNFSNDKTKVLVEEYLNDKRIKFIEYDNKGIIAASRNYGASFAKGEYIAFLDSDDIWDKDKLAFQLDSLDDEIVLIATTFKVIGEIKMYYDQLRFSSESNAYMDLSYHDIIHKNQILTSSALMRKKDFNFVGGFDQSPNFVCIEDWELWLRVSKMKNAKIRIVNKPLVYYRVFISPQRSHAKIEENKLTVFQKHKDMGYITALDLKKLRHRQFVRIGIIALKVNDYSKMKYFFKAMILSNSLKMKIVCVFGLLIFILPFRLRLFFINWFRSFKSRLVT